MIAYKIIGLMFCVFTIAHTMPLELKDYDNGPVAYEFEYSVNDKTTGDIKSQRESRKDDRVEGVYELIDADGYRRIVEYKADDKNGFEAIVTREPTDIKIPQPEPNKVLSPSKLLLVKPTYLLKTPLEKRSENSVSFSAPLINYKY